MEKKLILEIKSLTKSFGGLIAVDNAEYKINEREALGIIGPNGAGKTTFFNLITGLLYPDKGNIIFMRRNITKFPPYKRVKEKIIRTFQLVSVFNELRVIDNLILSIVRFEKEYKIRSKFFFKNINRINITEKCFKYLEIMGLENKAYLMTDELSYGDKRKLEIAIAISLKPVILLLDEPFSGLSDIEIQEVINLIKGMRNRFSFVIIEHKVSKLLDLIDKLAVMHEGKIIINDEPNKVLSNKVIKEIYFGKEEDLECY